MTITKCPICGQQHTTPIKSYGFDLQPNEKCSSYISEREQAHQAIANSLSLSESLSEQNKKAESENEALKKAIGIIDSQIKEEELLSNTINREIDSLADSEDRLNNKISELERLKSQLEAIKKKIKETEDIETLKKHAETCKLYRDLTIK